MADVVAWFTDPYAFGFMQRALVSLLIVSVVGAVVGTFVVNKGLAFSGDALAHSTLAGVAVAFVSGGNVSAGALVAAVLTALAVGWTRRRARVSYDTAIGIAFVAAFSLGILILSTRQGYTPDLFSFVFGSILGISTPDLVGAAILALGVLAFVAAFYRELIMTAYDPAAAAAAGVRSTLFQYALLILIAVAVVVALKAIGIVLVNAMLIIPAATAGLVAHRVPRIMLYATGFAMLSSFAGLQLSFHAGVAASPAVVLVAAGLFAFTVFVTSRRGPRLRTAEAPA